MGLHVVASVKKGAQHMVKTFIDESSVPYRYRPCFDNEEHKQSDIGPYTVPIVARPLRSAFQRPGHYPETRGIVRVRNAESLVNANSGSFTAPVQVAS